MKLMVLDGNSIVNRAYYGIRPLTTRQGLYTNAIYGFVTTLQRLLDEEKPEALCVTFDRREPTFRHQADASYKAQRKGMPEELAMQMLPLKQVLTAMSIPQYELTGYEADDLIGTISRKCEADGWDCVVVTGDKDSLQLITDHTKVKLVSTRMGQTTTKDMTPETFRETYGFAPIHMIDLKALMGDSSDNIPGVPGIGEKTAMALVQEYGSIDALYAQMPDVHAKPAALRKLQEGEEAARHSYWLATIVTDAPLDFKPEDNLRQPFKPELYDLFLRLEFQKLIDKYGLSPSRTVEEKPSHTAHAEIVETAARAEELLTLWRAAAHVTVYGLPDLSALAVECEMGENATLMAELYENRYAGNWHDLLASLFAADIKRWGITSRIPCAPCWSGSCPPRASCSTRRWRPTSATPPPAATISPSCSSPFIMRSCPSPPTCRRRRSPPCWGTTRRHRRRSSAIPPPCRRSTERWRPSCGSWTWRRSTTMWSCRCAGCWRRWRRRAFWWIGRRWPSTARRCRASWTRRSRPFTTRRGRRSTSTPPSSWGSFCLKSWVCPTAKDEDRLVHQCRCAGKAAVRRAHRGGCAALPAVRQAEKHLCGRALEGHRPGRPGAYQLPDDRDGYGPSQLHRAEFAEYPHPHGAGQPAAADVHRAGGLCAGGRGLLPDRAAAAGTHRRRCGDAGGVPVGADFHTVTASRVFHVPPEEVTPEMRRRAKAVNFGIVYGISAFSLAQDIGVSVAEAKAYMERYFETYQGVRQYMTDVVAKAEQDGYVQTLMHRRRALPELKSSNFNLREFGKRVALNMPVQGTAADIMKLAMVRVHRRLKREGLRARLLMQVHDELIVECPASEREQVERLLTEEMEQAASLSVPLIAEAHSGKNWLAAKE